MFIDEVADVLYNHIKKTQIDDIILQSLLDELLNRLNNHDIKCPRTDRTLLKTNKLPCNIIEKPQLLYYKFSSVNSIKEYIKSQTLDISRLINISLNIDGLPLFIVDELNSLLENGIRVGSKLYKFRLKCITWDVKSFERGSKQFNSNHGYNECLILVTNIKGSNFYLETSFTKRTDIDFRNKTYVLHHNKILH